MIPSNNSQQAGPSWQYQSDQDIASSVSNDKTRKSGILNQFSRLFTNPISQKISIPINKRSTDVESPAISILPTGKKLSQKDKDIAKLKEFSNAISQSVASAKALIKANGTHGYMRLAARYDYIDIIKYLVENTGAEVYKSSYHAPILEAVNCGHLDIVDYLTDHGLDKDNTYYINCLRCGQDGLVFAAVYSSKMDIETARSMIYLLLTKGESADGYGFIPPVWQAKTLKKTELVDFLLRYGADPAGLKDFDHKRAQMHFDKKDHDPFRPFTKARDYHSIRKAEGAEDVIRSTAAKTKASCNIDAVITTVRDTPTKLPPDPDPHFDLHPPFNPNYPEPPAPSYEPSGFDPVPVEPPPSYEESMKPPSYKDTMNRPG